MICRSKGPFVEEGKQETPDAPWSVGPFRYGPSEVGSADLQRQSFCLPPHCRTINAEHLYSTLEIILH
jgi:hypothetical protein